MDYPALEFLIPADPPLLPGRIWPIPGPRVLFGGLARFLLGVPSPYRIVKGGQKGDQRTSCNAKENPGIQRQPIGALQARQAGSYDRDIEPSLAFQRITDNAVPQPSLPTGYRWQDAAGRSVIRHWWVTEHKNSRHCSSLAHRCQDCRKVRADIRAISYQRGAGIPAQLNCNERCPTNGRKSCPPVEIVVVETLPWKACGTNSGLTWANISCKALKVNGPVTNFLMLSKYAARRKD
jgi:hypothetical protein